MKSLHFSKTGRAVALACLFALIVPATVFAASAKVIDAEVQEALDVFKKTAGAEKLLSKAAGVLVFPSIVKAGFGIGGEYGEGALMVRNKTIDYYSTAAASVGLQLGAQKKTVIYVFMTQEALENFQISDGWKVGVDASVAIVTVGVGKSVDTYYTAETPIMAFILDQKGLMYNITLEGSKLSKINR